MPFKIIRQNGLAKVINTVSGNSITKSFIPLQKAKEQLQILRSAEQLEKQKNKMLKFLSSTST